MRNRIKIIVQLVSLVILLSVMPLVSLASDTPASSGHQAAAHATVGKSAVPGQEAAGHQVAAQAEAGHGVVHANPLSSEKLWDLAFRIMNFAGLVYLLVRYLGKPIGTALTGRQQQIKEELDGLIARRDVAEKSYKEFEARLAGMEQEMESVVQRAIAQAQIEKERILAEAEKAAADIKRQAEAAVQAEFEDAKRLLREEVAEQAAAMAEELIIKNLTPADQVAITEQYLERVGAVQ